MDELHKSSGINTGFAQVFNYRPYNPEAQAARVMAKKAAEDRNAIMRQNEAMSRLGSVLKMPTNYFPDDQDEITKKFQEVSDKAAEYASKGIDPTNPMNREAFRELRTGMAEIDNLAKNSYFRQNALSAAQKAYDPNKHDAVHFEHRYEALRNAPLKDVRDMPLDFTIPPFRESDIWDITKDVLNGRYPQTKNQADTAFDLVMADERGQQWFLDASRNESSHIKTVEDAKKKFMDYYESTKKIYAPKAPKQTNSFKFGNGGATTPSGIKWNWASNYSTSSGRIDTFQASSKNGGSLPSRNLDVHTYTEHSDENGYQLDVDNALVNGAFEFSKAVYLGEEQGWAAMGTVKYRTTQGSGPDKKEVTVTKPAIQYYEENPTYLDSFVGEDGNWTWFVEQAELARKSGSTGKVQSTTTGGGTKSQTPKSEKEGELDHLITGE